MTVPSAGPSVATIVAQCAVWSVAALTVASGFEKQRRPSRSVQMWGQLSGGRLTERAGRALTIALGMVELGIGVLALISPGMLSAYALAAFITLLAAGAAVAVAASGDRPVPCGCFGERGGTLSWRHVMLNAALAALTLAAAGLGHLERSALLSARSSIVMAAVAAAVATGWWWLYAQAGSSPYRATAHSE